MTDISETEKKHPLPPKSYIVLILIIFFVHNIWLKFVNCMIRNVHFLFPFYFLLTQTCHSILFFFFIYFFYDVYLTILYFFDGTVFLSILSSDN